MSQIQVSLDSDLTWQLLSVVLVLQVVRKTLVFGYIPQKIHMVCRTINMFYSIWIPFYVN